MDRLGGEMGEEKLAKRADAQTHGGEEALDCDGRTA